VPGFGKYESTLERDFMEILRFDPDVEEFAAQPMTIDYVDANGKTRKYTPDGFIKFKQRSGVGAPSILYEIKYREDFRKEWRDLMPKFRAAKRYALQRGWRFEVYTEREIRTAYLNNVRFLQPYLERIPEEGVAKHVLLILNDLDEADPDLLLCALSSDSNNRAFYIPIIWHLVAIGEIDCDLEKPLTMRSVTSSSISGRGH